MENLTPLWEPGTNTGYHAVNFGWLVGEIVRRVDGRSIGTFLREEVAGALGLEHLHIGLPSGHEANVARLRKPTAELSPAMQEVLARWGDPGSIPGKVIPPPIADMSDFQNARKRTARRSRRRAASRPRVTSRGYTPASAPAGHSTA